MQASPATTATAPTPSPEQQLNPAAAAPLKPKQRHPDAAQAASIGNVLAPLARSLQSVNLSNDAGVQVVQAAAFNPETQAVAGFTVQLYARGRACVEIGSNDRVHQARVARRAVTVHRAREA